MRTGFKPPSPCRILSVRIRRAKSAILPQACRRRCLGQAVTNVATTLRGGRRDCRLGVAGSKRAPRRSPQAREECAAGASAVIAGSSGILCSTPGTRRSGRRNTHQRSRCDEPPQIPDYDTARWHRADRWTRAQPADDRLEGLRGKVARHAAKLAFLCFKRRLSGAGHVTTAACSEKRSPTGTPDGMEHKLMRAAWRRLAPT
jgi:hypothetical protein